jgi:hypothetical protein
MGDAQFATALETGRALTVDTAIVEAQVLAATLSSAAR